MAFDIYVWCNSRDGVGGAGSDPSEDTNPLRLAGEIQIGMDQGLLILAWIVKVPWGCAMVPCAVQMSQQCNDICCHTPSRSHLANTGGDGGGGTPTYFDGKKLLSIMCHHYANRKNCTKTAILASTDPEFLVVIFTFLVLELRIVAHFWLEFSRRSCFRTRHTLE